MSETHNGGTKQNNEDFSSDELVIDLSATEKKEKLKPKKRKRNGSESSEDEIINEIEGAEEINQNVTSVAVKNNLTSDNVKSILKRVVLNEHVLAVVKLREEEMETNSDEIVEPKLTRAKTKKLKSTISTVSWPLPITPVKVPKSVSPEVTSLISQDLPDEESDEEYKPNLGDHSDDDKDTIESSDVESLPLTPATPDVSISNSFTNGDIKYTDDGVFKIPQNIDGDNRELTDAEATIALRTRSKLCLSDIPIERIEESFFPPDITKDMYEIEDCQMDEVWRDFLKEFSKPLSNTNEDDEDADPEYNAAAETEILDVEELREDDDVEVTKKELADLVEELFNDMDEILQIEGMCLSTIPQDNTISNYDISTENDCDTSKNNCSFIEDTSNILSRVESSDISFNNEITTGDEPEFCAVNNDSTPLDSHPEQAISSDPQPEQVDVFHYVWNEKSQKFEKSNGTSKAPFMAKFKKRNDVDDYKNDRFFDWKYKEGDGVLLPEQRALLDQQMRQHVQLATQIFLQVYSHFVYWKHAPKEKEILMSLKYLGKGSPDSAFTPCNLLPAIELCESWEKRLSVNTSDVKELFSHVVKENEKMERRAQQKGACYGTFPKMFTETLWNSDVFVYSKLLPCHPFRIQMGVKEYFESENQLIAMGLEEFYLYLQANKQDRPSKYDPRGFSKVADMVCKYLLPHRHAKHVRYHITKMRRSKKPNPIRYYYDHGRAPLTKNTLLRFVPGRAVKDFPVDSLPYVWQKKYYLDLHGKNSKKNRLLRPLLNDRNPRADWSIVRNRPRVRDSSPPASLPSPPSPPSLPSLPSLPSPPGQRLLLPPPDSGADAPPEPVPRNQRFITDFFGDGERRPREHRPVGLHTRRLRYLRNLCRDRPLRVLESFNFRVDKRPSLSATIRETFKLRLGQAIEMLPSMPFISSNSKDSGEVTDETTFPTPPCPKNGDEKSSAVPKPVQLPNQGKQRSALKAQKALEANRAMFISDDPYADDLKETLYAASYLDKVKARLGPSSEDGENEITFEKFRNIMNSFNPLIETPSELYLRVEKFFGTRHADLTEEFLTFLTPGQADRVGKFMDRFMLACISDFIERLQIYFANKPTHLRKVLWCLERLTEKPESELTTENIKNTIVPLLKGNQYLIDWFLKLFPDERPPESLVNHGYETLDCERLFKENGEGAFSGVSMDFETLHLPPVEDNYGNESCTCVCHRSMDKKYKNRSRHCLACGMKYIQGRVYIQHGRTLRAVHLNWLDHENGTVSQARRLSAPLESRQLSSRKKGLAIESVQNSTGRNDSDDERISPKRGSKCLRTPTSKSKTLKTNLSRNISKSSESSDAKNNSTKSNIKDNELQNKSTEEKFPQNKPFEGVQDETIRGTSSFKPNEYENIIIKQELHTEINLPDENFEAENSESDTGPEQSTDICHIKSEILCEESESSQPSLIKSNDEFSWTRNEDKVILLILRSDLEYEDILSNIKKLLPHRTLECISDRVQRVMALLKKIASDP